MAENDIPLTAFSTPTGKYCFKVLRFGLTCSPSAFMNMMSKALQGIGTDASILCCVDDVIALKRDMGGTLQIAGTFVQCPSRGRFNIKILENHFGPKQVKYLGHALSADGIFMSNDRIRAIVEVPQPQSKIYDLFWTFATQSEDEFPDMPTSQPPLLS